MIKSHPVLTKLIITAPLLSLLACAQAPKMTMEEMAMIGLEMQALDQQFAADIDRGDAAAAAALYTEDARLLPPNSDAVVGREAIQAFFQQSLIDAGVRDIEFMQAEVHVMGKMAYDRGEIQLTVQPEMGEPMMDKSKYVCTWTRVNGEWKIDICIWNSSMPLPEPMPEPMSEE